MLQDASFSQRSGSILRGTASVNREMQILSGVMVWVGHPHELCKQDCCKMVHLLSTAQRFWIVVKWFICSSFALYSRAFLQSINNTNFPWAALNVLSLDFHNTNTLVSYSATLPVICGTRSLWALRRTAAKSDGSPWLTLWIDTPQQMWDWSFSDHSLFLAWHVSALSQRAAFSSQSLLMLSVKYTQATKLSNCKK